MEKLSITATIFIISTAHNDVVVFFYAKACPKANLKTRKCFIHMTHLCNASIDNDSMVKAVPQAMAMIYTRRVI